MNKLFRTVILLLFFSIAMGFMESSVVIYLRQLYYPDGFCFPLRPAPLSMTYIEFLREGATVIMLLVIGIIAGKNLAERISFFVFCFAVWDLFYYLFLFIFIGWPDSIFTWDILFFLPVPWVGPVLSPCIISFTLILLSLSIIYFHQKGITVVINPREWIGLIIGSLLVILSFTIDFMVYAYYVKVPAVIEISIQRYFFRVCTFIPHTFNWWLFMSGEILLVISIIAIIARNRVRYYNKN